MCSTVVKLGLTGFSINLAKAILHKKYSSIGPNKLKRSSLFIYYKNIIFLSKPSKEIEIATNKITMMFLILGQFQALMFS